MLTFRIASAKKSTSFRTVYSVKSARDTTTGTKNSKRVDAGREPVQENDTNQQKSAELIFGNLAFENYDDENERRYWKLLSDQEGNSIKKERKTTNKQTI